MEFFKRLLCIAVEIQFDSLNLEMGQKVRGFAIVSFENIPVAIC